jgi:mono/diheme cytochrome c family protein
MRKFVRAKGAVWLMSTVLLAVGSLAAKQSASSSDDDQGKALVESKCTLCHGLDEVRTAYLDKPGWQESVEFMRTKGAELKDEEVPIIVNYLLKTYSQDPDADTKKLVEGDCGSCHGMDIVASAQKTKDEWNGVVREMISYGADIKEPQIPAVVEYLAKNYGPKK